MPVGKICVVCGKPFSVPPSRAETATTCSNECAVSVRAKSRERKTSCLCKECGKEFKVAQSHSGRRVYCSHACKNNSDAYVSEMSARTSGEKNPMWKGGEVRHADGYVYVRSVGHPFTKTGYVFKHRLVMEQWLKEDAPQSRFLIVVGGVLYLNPDCDVHHLDGNTGNNERLNLLACTGQTHRSIHAGYGAIQGTFWPETADVKIDTVAPEIRQRERRKEQRKLRRLSK